MDNYSWHAFGDVAEEPAMDLVAAMGWPIKKVEHDSHTFNDIPEEQILDVQEACNVSLTDSCAYVAHDEVPMYLWGTQLLVDCLLSEAYITASLRKSLLEGLCLEI
jgi:hypothetical protein